MSFSIHQVAVPVFSQGLTALSGLLAKAQAFAEAKKVDPAVMLNLRLYPDMFPFVRQVQTACDHAKGAVARLAGTEIPTHADTEANFAELSARVDKTLSFVKGFKPGQFEGAEDRQIVLLLGPKKEFKLEFTGADYLTKFATPNFYFHLTTAYAILRHCGVEIGKRDFLGGV